MRPTSSLPEVSVITSIGLDHTDMLGNTLAEIAREKGWNHQAGRPVVIGKLPAKLNRCIRSRAAERDARIISVSSTIR